MSRLQRRVLKSLVLLGVGAVALMVVRPNVDAQQPAVAPALYSGLHWRLLGPFRSGRVDAVSGVVGHPNEFYFGAVNGGVWKTINAGRTWFPVFDSEPVASIGALAVSASNPDIVYVGTGESTLRDSMGYGDGMYKSTDAGKTWTHIGLDATQHIGKVAIDPKNPDVVFVAAIGDMYAAHPDRGVYRSLDGGKTWEKVLYKDDNTGAIDVVIDPTNSRVVYADLWATRRPPWYTYPPSNSPGGGIYKSTDGGKTWKQLTAGLPTKNFGRSGIAVAPSNPKRVYAVIDTADNTPRAAGEPAPEPTGGLYRSDDAGATWTRMSGDTRVWGRGWYFECVAVDPKNPDIVFVPNVGVQKSTDGGKTFGQWAIKGSPGGDDYHQLWIYPSDPDIMIVASDQGSIVTLNGTAPTPEWSSWLNQPIAQIYHVSADYGFPYWVTGAQQDSGAVAVRSRGKFGEISMRDWEPIGAGGESGYTAADPLHPGMVYGGTGSYYDLALNRSLPTGRPRSDEPERTDWTAPLVISQADPHAMYYASQFLFKTTDGAQTWTEISPDLTRPDPGVPLNLDPVAATDYNTDNHRNDRRGVIYTVAPSPLLIPMVWIGTDDGFIQVTTDDGQTWRNVTPPAVTSWSRVTTMEASHYDVSEAYASVDRHQLDDFAPHIYRTRDMGKTWQEITRGLPADGYVHVVKEDPARRGLLFAGTERGAFVSFDDGDSWQSLQLNLPVTSVRDFEVHDGDLIVATHGRGFWVIDDIATLRQLQPAMSQASAVLFKPADAIAVIQGGDNGTPLQKDEPQAENPPVGAYVDYYLKSTATGPVTLEILDENGQTIRSYSSADQPLQTTSPQTVTVLWERTAEPLSAQAGMHRFVWDLRGAGGGGRGFGRGGGGGRGGAGARGAAAGAAGAGGGRGGRGGRAGGGGFGGFGGRGGGAGLMTGTFTAKLTVDGQTYTQTFEVKPDPRR
jgi:photosystem II stability/assembly factor-like uncharacterized protein